MKKIFAANWKLHKNPTEARAFCQELLSSINRHQDLHKKSFFDDKEIMIFPQNFSLEAVAQKLSGSPLFFGPQNIYFEKTGAFTGENSASLAFDIGAQAVLIGHSERRQIFGEESRALNQKIILCQQLNLLPVLCIGETLDQRESGETEKICFDQLNLALDQINPQKRIVIAYEPVWAIGTGKVATVQQVQEIHQKIFDHMKTLHFENFQLLYGGSVKPDNASELLQVPHVDGFLVGGASLAVDSFLKICQS